MTALRSPPTASRQSTNWQTWPSHGRSGCVPLIGYEEALESAELTCRKNLGWHDSRCDVHLPGSQGVPLPSAAPQLPRISYRAPVVRPERHRASLLPRPGGQLLPPVCAWAAPHWHVRRQLRQDLSAQITPGCDLVSCQSRGPPGSWWRKTPHVAARFGRKLPATEGRSPSRSERSTDCCLNRWPPVLAALTARIEQRRRSPAHSPTTG